MTAHEAMTSLMTLDGPPITDSSAIGCPKCRRVSSLATWTESEVDCDACGWHYGVKCPSCLVVFDPILVDRDIVFRVWQ